MKKSTTAFSRLINTRENQLVVFEHNEFLLLYHKKIYIFLGFSEAPTKDTYEYLAKFCEFQNNESLELVKPVEMQESQV